MAINHQEVDDMFEASARWCRAFTRLALPATGRHRAAGAPTAPVYAARVERWLRRWRRWVLWLALVGVDAGPRWIHGVRVAAR